MVSPAGCADRSGRRCCPGAAGSCRRAPAPGWRRRSRRGPSVRPRPPRKPGGRKLTSVRHSGTRPTSRAEALQRLVHRIELGRGDVQHADILLALPLLAIGLEQIVERHLVDRAQHCGRPSGAPRGEDVAAELRPRHQARARLLHRLEPLQLMGQRRGQLGAARLVRRLRLGQQQARLEVGEPRRHDEIVGGDLEPQLARRRDEGEVLVGELQDRDLGEVDLLLARQREQHVDRPLIAVEIDDELRRLPAARLAPARRAPARSCQRRVGQPHDGAQQPIRRHADDVAKDVRDPCAGAGRSSARRTAVRSG